MVNTRYSLEALEKSGDHKYSDMVMEARWARLLPTPDVDPERPVYR